MVGGGLFGCYAALYLARGGRRTLLVEGDEELCSRASVVNQARLHAGYHYPRSVATARQSDENKARFTRDHQAFIRTDFEKLYAIDRYGSLTDAAGFERFCRYLDLPCEQLTSHPLLDFGRLEAVFRTVEYTFDPPRLAAYYRQLVADQPGLEVRRATQFTAAAPLTADCWRATLVPRDGNPVVMVDAGLILNATYAELNAVNRACGLPLRGLMHEISEMAFVYSRAFGNTGLTVMDGPFCSLMPYGQGGLLSLSSVAYTHHRVSYDAEPTFSCQQERPDCTPATLRNCRTCPVRPASNYPKMLAQVRRYLHPAVDLAYRESAFTVKSKLLANFIDDGRPTAVDKVGEGPDFYCLFAGKINSIYAVEELGIGG